MKLHPAIEKLFGGGAVLYYEGTFKDQPFTKQWSQLGRADDAGYELDLYLELDPRPLGQGGQVLKERCRLVLDPELRPRGYGSEAAGVRISLTIDGTKATAFLPDKTKVEVDTGGARFIVESNITGLDALLFAIAHEGGELEREVQLTSFLLNQLMAIPYTVTPRGGGQFTSSYDEVLQIDGGVLQSTHIVKASVWFRRKPAPPLPYWATMPDGTRPFDLLRYVPPADRSFELQDVSIASRGGEIGGTLTIPRGTGPFPAVLFLSGTGTHDRHGIAGNLDIGSHEIVDHLSEHGYVGLRFDTRGAGTTKAGEDALDSSLAPLIDHARAWLGYLQRRPEVDPSRITLIGHSQGGTVALIIAADRDPVAPASVVLLATPGRPLHEVLEAQIDHQARVLGLTDQQREQHLAEHRELIAAVEAGTPFEAGSVRDALVPAARRVAWLKDHLGLDPAALVKQLRCPLLIAQGAKDFQVSVRDAERLHAAAQEGGLDVALQVYPALDHLFKPCEGASTLELYYDITRRVDRELLGKLLGWLVR